MAGWSESAVDKQVQAVAGDRYDPRKTAIRFMIQISKRCAGIALRLVRGSAGKCGCISSLPCELSGMVSLRRRGGELLGCRGVAYQQRSARVGPQRRGRVPRVALYFRCVSLDPALAVDWTFASSKAQLSSCAKPSLPLVREKKRRPWSTGIVGAHAIVNNLGDFALAGRKKKKKRRVQTQ